MRNRIYICICARGQISQSFFAGVSTAFFARIFTTRAPRLRESDLPRKYFAPSPPAAAPHCRRARRKSRIGSPRKKNAGAGKSGNAAPPGKRRKNSRLRQVRAKERNRRQNGVFAFGIIKSSGARKASGFSAGRRRFFNVAIYAQKNNSAFLKAQFFPKTRMLKPSRKIRNARVRRQGGLD